jgi:hypothetical protein
MARKYKPLIDWVVFSKDRPLQLDGYLRSRSRHATPGYLPNVLVRAEGEYEQAYSQLAGDFLAQASFKREDDFAAALCGVLEHHIHAPYVCFGCDDVVFTGPVDADAIDLAFRAEPALLGFSLRLGKHTDTDMFGRPMPAPAFAHPAPPPFQEYAWVDAAEARVQWDAAASAGDWGYPWEVLGTVYPTDYVRDTVAALVRDGQVQNPSTLEDAGWRRWREFAGERHLMQSFARSRLVVPTVNVVQSVFGNGIVGPAGMDPAFLLDCWNRGLRLDVDRYRGMTPPSWRIPDLFLRRAG